MTCDMCQSGGSWPSRKVTMSSPAHVSHTPDDSESAAKGLDTSSTDGSCLIAHVYCIIISALYVSV